MPRKQPTETVPVEMLYSGWRWETVRMNYYKRLGRMDDAHECANLRELYRRRLHGESIDDDAVIAWTDLVRRCLQRDIRTGRH